jgi:hypothetical protein
MLEEACLSPVTITGSLVDVRTGLFTTGRAATKPGHVTVPPKAEVNSLA